MVAEVEQRTGLTTAQAAALAGVSEKSIRNWLKAGQLKPMATTEGRRIDKQDLLDYLRERAQATVSHLPPEARPEATPESEPAPHHTPEVPPLTPEAINIVLQPLLDELEKERKEKRRLYDENVELAGRVGFYQAKVQEYEGRILLLEAPKEDPLEGHQMPVEAPVIIPWYKRLFKAG